MDDNQGKLWVVRSEGLDIIERNTRKVTHHIALNIPARESSFYEDRLGTFWIIFGSGNGLMVLDRKTNTLTRYSLYDEKSGQAIEDGVYAMLEDQDGVLWLATSTAGLLKFDRERRRFVRYRNFPGSTDRLEGEHLTTLFEDREA